ncbi:MAG: hypothetical protein ACTHZX_12360 [Microbacterium sp.]
MSTPHLTPSAAPAQRRKTCMCAHGEPCSSVAPGHALHLIQSRLAAATPLDWRDGIVDEIDRDAGTIRIRLLEGEARTVWTAARPAVLPGEPVALHERYGVLAAGRERVNVALIDA